MGCFLNRDFQTGLSRLKEPILRFLRSMEVKNK
jgi:hypothetical protein